MIKRYLLLILCLLTSLSHAQSLPYNNPVNGGVAIVPIEAKSKPQILYEGKQVAVIPSRQKNIWLILVGIPLDKSQTIQYLTMTSPVKGSIPFHVNKKNYKTQYISLKNQRKVTPNPEDEKRIADEHVKMAELFSEWRVIEKPFNDPFIAQVKGRISSQFGLKRVFNDKPRNPHTGLDIAAPQGTPVKATAKGKVIETGDYFFTGNTVFIEHGPKIIEMRRHLVMEKAEFAEELTALFENSEQRSNPWGIALSDRAKWTVDLDVPVLGDGVKAEYLFYVGCAGAFDSSGEYCYIKKTGTTRSRSDVNK